MTPTQEYVQSLPRVVQQLIAQISAEYGVSAENLLSHSQRRDFAQPRQALYTALRSVTWPDGSQRFSYPDIARLTLREDHTTVIHGVRRHAERMGVAA